MQIYIFDMDGVLLKPRGYHRALQDTVRLAGQDLGFGEVLLTNEQIAQFEALGISSEWHSSALCLSMLTLASQTGNSSNELRLEPLFEAIAAQPLSIIPRKRAEAAISKLAQQAGIPADAALAWIQQSEQIESSHTMHLFQSMILGDQIFSRMYGISAKMQTQSYLKLYDENSLSDEINIRLNNWTESPSRGAAIMTLRPSYGPENILGAPDAEFGAQLVGLNYLPLLGYGEMTWLANELSKPVAEVTKPNPKHALAAILAASGWDINESLKFVSHPPKSWESTALEQLRGSQITVFEDTPAGVVSVQAAGDLLNQAGLGVSVQNIGIATDTAKISAMEAMGAEVFPDINQALAGLDHT